MTDVLNPIVPTTDGAPDSVDRFFLPVMKVVLPQLVNKVLTLHRGVEADADRGLGDFLSASLDNMIDLLPALVEQVQSAHRELPAGSRDPEAQDRFWGAVVSAVAPYAIKYGSKYGAKYGGKAVKHIFRDAPGEPDIDLRALVPTLNTSVIADNLDEISRVVNGAR